MIVTAKVVAIVFGLATLAFCVSTIVLAVQNSNLEDDLQEARNKLDALNAQTTTTTWTTITSTDTAATSMTDSTLSPTSTPTSPPTLTPPTSTPSSTPTSTAAITSSTPVDPNVTTEFPWPTITIPTESTTTTTLAPGFKDPEKIIYRLPTDLRPIKYRLYFHPDLQTHTSENTVSVQVEVENVTNLIVMHAKNLEIDGISILNMMLRMRMSVKRFYLSEREFLIIEMNELLRKATPYVVSISYRNNLNGLSGIYASSYIDENGDNK